MTNHRGVLYWIACGSPAATRVVEGLPIEKLTHPSTMFLAMSSLMNSTKELLSYKVSRWHCA